MSYRNLIQERYISLWLISMVLFTINLFLFGKLLFMLRSKRIVIDSCSVLVTGWCNWNVYFTFGDNPNQIFPSAYSRVYSQLLRMSGMIKLPAILAKNVTTNTLVSIFTLFCILQSCGCSV